MLGYDEPMLRDHATVTLLPAGHMLGSAQLLLEHDGQAFFTQETSSCACQVHAADPRAEKRMY